MTRTFLFTFTILYCYSLSGQAIGPKRFLWTPVVRPLNHLPKTGVNRFDPTKRGQSFTHTARWGRYPEQFKPTPKSIRVGNTDITVSGRGYPKGSPQRSLSGRGYMGQRPSVHTHVQEDGIVPRIDLFGTPQALMTDSSPPRFSDFILDYRTDIFTSRTPHGFFTGDLVKFDALPALSNAALRGNDRNPEFGTNPIDRLNPGRNPVHNQLPGLLNEDGYFVADMGQSGANLALGGNRFETAELNSTVFAVRRLDDYRLQLHPNINSSMDLPRQVLRNEIPSGFPDFNQAIYDYRGAKASNFVIADPVIGPLAPLQIEEFTKAPYTLGHWKDICVSSDSISSAGITLRRNNAAGGGFPGDSLNWNTGVHNLVNGQGVFFDGNPPAGLNTEDTFYARAVDNNSIQLFTTSAAARGGGAAGRVDLQPGGMHAGAVTFNLFKCFQVFRNGPPIPNQLLANPNLPESAGEDDRPSHYIDRANHGLKTGDVVYWNRTRWTASPGSGPGAIPPDANPPGANTPGLQPWNGGQLPSNEHYYVSVGNPAATDGTERRVWLHLNESNATANGDIGPGANAIRLDFDGPPFHDTVGNNLFPIYSRRLTPVDNPNNPRDNWKWRTTQVQAVVEETVVDVDRWQTQRHAGETPVGGTDIRMVRSGAADTTIPLWQNSELVIANNPWRTGDKIVFQGAAVDPTFPVNVTAGTIYWVHNRYEEGGDPVTGLPSFNTITLHTNITAANLWSVYQNNAGTRVTLGDPLNVNNQGRNHTINGVNKCVVNNNGPHNLETGDRVLVTAFSVNTAAQPNPPEFGFVRKFTALDPQAWVSVRSIERSAGSAAGAPRTAGNDAWIYFHANYLDAINTQKPQQPGQPAGAQGEREAPNRNPIDMWNGTNFDQNTNSWGRVTAHKMLLQDNAARLRPGDDVIFSDAAPPAAAQLGQNFVSVSRGNNNQDTDRDTWGNVLWPDMGGPGRGQFNRGNNPDLWWLHLHGDRASATARSIARVPNLATTTFIGQGSGQVFCQPLGNNAIFNFHRATTADMINQGGTQASPVWTQAQTGTAVNVTAAPGAAPAGTTWATFPFGPTPNFATSLWYIRKNGPGDEDNPPGPIEDGGPGKDISFHPTQRDALQGTNPVMFGGNPGTQFTISISGLSVVSGGGGNIPFQNGDRVRFVDMDNDGTLADNTPSVIDNDDPTGQLGGNYTPRPADLFSQEDAPNTGANSPKYRYFYVSINDANPGQFFLHETYEDAWNNGGAAYGQGQGDFAIAYDNTNSPWTLEWIRPPRFTNRTQFKLTNSHQTQLPFALQEDDVLYFAPGAGGKLPVTWDPDIDIDGDGDADGSWRGLEMNTPYRVMHSMMGQVDRPRGAPYENWAGGGFIGQNEAGAGPQTGFNGYLSPTSRLVNNAYPAEPHVQRGHALHVAYESNEAQIVEGVDSSAQMRATERALGIWSGDLVTDGAGQVMAAGRPENLFNAYRDTGRVRVRLRNEDSHTNREQLPGTDPTQIFIGTSPRRSYRSEFRLKFLRHNFYHVGADIDNPSNDNNCLNYWREYRYFATYEAIQNKNNRVGLEANATFIVLGTPRGFVVNDLQDIIPVSGLTLAAADAGNRGPGYQAPHLTDPWANPSIYLANHGWDSSVTINGARRWNFIPQDNSIAELPGTDFICWKRVYPQGRIAAAAERIRHPEDLDMENLIRVVRGPLELAPVGNPPQPIGPLQCVNGGPPNFEDVLGANNALTGYTPFGADPDTVDGNELPNMPFGANIDVHDVYRNMNTVDGTGPSLVDNIDNGTFPLTLGGAITRENYSYPRWGHRWNATIQNDEPDRRNFSGNGPKDFGTDTLGVTWGNDDVGVREYDRNNGYDNLQMFGDFFIDPGMTTTNISTAGGTERRNTVTKAQLNGTNPINVLAVPGVASHNQLISTRNISEVMRFGDLGQKIRRMNRFPKEYGPEYIFSRLEEWPPGSGNYRVELVPNVQNANSRIVIIR